MFIKKSSTEVIILNSEIHVVGLSLQKSGLPISFSSLGKLWEIYGEKYRGKNQNATIPVVEYAVCLNKVPDYIAGCSVSKIDDVKEDCAFFTIPTGKYIKDSFNAETFEHLTGEVMEKRNVKAWAKQNKIKINGQFTIEVYLEKTTQDNDFEMYTLTPIKE